MLDVCNQETRKTLASCSLTFNGYGVHAYLTRYSTLPAGVPRFKSYHSTLDEFGPSGHQLLRSVRGFYCKHFIRLFFSKLRLSIEAGIPTIERVIASSLLNRFDHDLMDPGLQVAVLVMSVYLSQCNMLERLRQTRQYFRTRSQASENSHPRAG